ncbi:hypothetical protein FRX31_013272 [Thalictrum thalictroides]|uniref:Uncharacterized protein n=1 Tax=Thalictrum thalictroides TaxID=46969 RepID=A0A7J6WKJ2_THATH|nr:hypothetical protein FRX31_013272 [Thalictrum thalictroides]
MERIGKSYVNTLRTLPNSGFIEGILNNLEPIVRTAPHPLGLAQCYYVAQVMSIHGQLTQPLQIRIRTCPPPVQRVFIVRSAANEWTGLPAGAYLNVMYKSFLEQIDREIARIELEPLAYSSLHNYYDIPKQKEMNARTIKTLTAVLPAVYGYAMAQHSNEKTGRDGIALALN